MNQNGVFHKIPSSQFYLIRIFFGPNPFSLTLQITCLMTCNRVDQGEQSKSKLGNSFLRYQASTFLFSFQSSFYYLICSSCFVCVITYFFKVGLYFLTYSEHVWLLELGFSFLLCFSACLFLGQGSDMSAYTYFLYVHAGSKYAYAYNWPTYAGLCMRMHTCA